MATMFRTRKPAAPSDDPSAWIDQAESVERRRRHLDIATNSVPDEVARHEDWGARAIEHFPHWTTMADPVGRRYCITSRNPRTGD